MSAEKCVNLYFVRHGQTKWNSEGILQGTTDIPLNSVGRYQADMRGRSLQDINFAHAYSSPLLRTLETASRIYANRYDKIVSISGLKERGYGEFEGKDYQLSKEARHTFLNSAQTPEDNPHGIETDKELEERLIPLLKHIATAHLSESLVGKPVNDLFVTHSGVMRFLLNHFGFMNYKKLEHYKIEETACMRVKFDGKSFNVMYIEGLTPRNGK